MAISPDASSLRLFRTFRDARPAAASWCRMYPSEPTRKEWCDEPRTCDDDDLRQRLLLLVAHPGHAYFQYEEGFGAYFWSHMRASLFLNTLEAGYRPCLLANPITNDNTAISFHDSSCDASWSMVERRCTWRQELQTLTSSRYPNQDQQGA